MLLAIAFAFQFMFWALASHAVLAAAAAGGDFARARESSLQVGATVARNELAAIAPGLVLDPIVITRETEAGDDVIIVGGAVASVFPGIHLRVGAVTVGPRNEFRGSG